MAKRKLGLPAPSYRAKGSRVDLVSDRRFKKAFSDAKEQIRGMQVRFVSVDDPIAQALMEVYASLALKTPYNEFKTT